MEEVLGAILFAMRDYQKENGIINKCIDNTQFYYDVLKPHFGERITFKPVFVLYNREDTTIIHIHMVLLFDDALIEPSYEIFKIKDKVYYGTIADVKDIISKKDVITFLKFISCAEKMNNNEFVITDRDYYHKQANYVETKTGLIFAPVKKNCSQLYKG